MKQHTIGWRSLKYVAPNLSAARAKQLAKALGPAMYEAHAATPRRAAYMIAQFAHETDGFRTLQEYATGAAYEGRYDLGNVHPGDGRRYKGRSFIMATGRDNYAKLSKELKHDFLAHPGHLAWPRYAARASCLWWTLHNCNHYADRGDFIGLTRVINGGTNGLDSREAYLRRAQHVSRWLVPKLRKV